MKETDLPTPVPFLHRDISTQSQVTVLLQVTGMMITALTSLNDEDATKQTEAHVAAENTFIKALERLDEMLDDKTRWTPEFQKSLERLYEEQHENRTKAFKAQRQVAEIQARVANVQEKVSEEMLTPHFRYKPAIYQLEDGKWICLLGDPANSASGVIGTGKTPKEAVEAFDAFFNGEIPDPLHAWLHRREQDLESGRQTEQFPTLYEQIIDDQTAKDSGAPPGVPEGGDKDPGQDGGAGQPRPV